MSQSEKNGDTHAYIAEDPFKIHSAEEARLSNVAFMHQRTFAKDLQHELRAMNAELAQEEEARF